MVAPAAPPPPGLPTPVRTGPRLKQLRWNKLGAPAQLDGTLWAEGGSRAAGDDGHGKWRAVDRDELCKLFAAKETTGGGGAPGSALRSAGLAVIAAATPKSKLAGRRV